MAGVGGLGQLSDGLTQNLGGRSGGAGHTTHRDRLGHVCNQSFVGDLREEAVEVVVDDSLEFVARVVDGSAAFRPGLAEGTEPVGGGLLAELPADETDEHAAGGDGADDPTGWVPAVDEGGGEQRAAGAEAKEAASILQRQTDGPGGLSGRGAGPVERAEGGAQIGPDVVGHQLKATSHVEL